MGLNQKWERISGMKFNQSYNFWTQIEANLPSIVALFMHPAVFIDPHHRPYKVPSCLLLKQDSRQELVVLERGWQGEQWGQPAPPYFGILCNTPPLVLDIGFLCNHNKRI